MFRKSAKVIALLLVLFCLVHAQEDDERAVVIPPGEFSITLLKEVTDYTNAYLDEHGATADTSKIMESVNASVVAAHPAINFNPTKPPLTIIECENNTSKKLAEAAAKEYPEPTPEQAAKMAEVFKWANVEAYSSIDDEQLRSIFITPVHDLQKAIDDAIAKYGPDCRVVFMPDGSVTVPVVMREST